MDAAMVAGLPSTTMMMRRECCCYLGRLIQKWTVHTPPIPSWQLDREFAEHPNLSSF
jgi:hypothetical protein